MPKGNRVWCCATCISFGECRGEREKGERKHKGRETSPGRLKPSSMQASLTLLSVRCSHPETNEDSGLCRCHHSPSFRKESKSEDDSLGLCCPIRQSLATCDYLNFNYLKLNVIKNSVPINRKTPHVHGLKDLILLR